MRVLAIDFPERWSWGLTSRPLYGRLAQALELAVMDLPTYRREQSTAEVDVILSQNLTQPLERGGATQIVQRLGGNRTFEEASEVATAKHARELSKCAAVIATNHYLYDVARRANAHTYLVPNGLDLTRWCPGPERAPMAKVTLGFVANVSTDWHAHYKGYHLVRRASQALDLPLKEALYRPPPRLAFRAWVVGTARSLLRVAGAHTPPLGTTPDEWPGRIRDGIWRLVRTPSRWAAFATWIGRTCTSLTRTLANVVLGPAQIPHNEMVERFWRQVDILVLPTAGEGCSNTIMEALACGVPVVTTNAAGFHGERLTDGLNVLFCERTFESVRDAIERLAASPALRARLSSEGRRFAEAHHDIIQIGATYEAILRDCWARHASRRAERSEGDSNDVGPYVGRGPRSRVSAASSSSMASHDGTR